jgi:PKD repeat protein
MVGKDVTNYYSYIVNNSASGFSRTRNGSGTTTSTLTVSDSTTTKEYLVAMRGDIDASNAVNTTDYTVMTQVCATTYKVDDGTAKFYAGDMNQDGAVDGFDVIALDLYANGDLLYN